MLSHFGFRLNLKENMFFPYPDSLSLNDLINFVPDIFIMDLHIIHKLKVALGKPLPGEKAQLLMGSGIRMNELRFMPMDESTKKSGVMILLYPFKKVIFSVLILRAKYEGTHSGQVALPGGKYEITDADLIQTALRETTEEIGVESGDIKVLGQLTPLYIPPSNFIVHPAVGYINYRPAFVADKCEVCDIIEYRLSELLKIENVKTKEFNVREDMVFTAPYFDIDGNVVWGATAMILSEFKEVLKEVISLKS
jgi:8-oxo-dGTP pyrophosphatase MutT (NUDIX family)